MNRLLLHQLQDLHCTLQQLVKTLSEIAETTTDLQLKQGFLTHLDETMCHVKHLEQMLDMHGAGMMATTCPAIDGIIHEASEVAGEIEDKSVVGPAMINAAQVAEHDETSRYGSLIGWAWQIGRNACANLLQKTRDVEKAGDRKRNTLAESPINLRAAS